MSTITQSKKLIAEGENLKTITQAYGQLAALKLRRIRSDVERNRAFLEEISSVYHIVKTEAAKRFNKHLIKDDKIVSVLITSNYRFYGSFNDDLIKNFLSSTKKFQTDKVIIGKTGNEFLEVTKYADPYKKIIFNRDFPSEQELKNLVQDLKSYKRIFIYYAKFQTILSQVPSVKDITESISSESAVRPHQLIQYIFEPEIDKILNFFDTQITTLLLEQMFLESELARTSARLIAMNQAENKSEVYVKEQKANYSHIRANIINTKLLETAAVLLNWRKHHEI